MDCFDLFGTVSGSNVVVRSVSDKVWPIRFQWLEIPQDRQSTLVLPCVEANVKCQNILKYTLSWFSFTTCSAFNLSWIRNSSWTIHLRKMIWLYQASDDQTTSRQQTSTYILNASGNTMHARPCARYNQFSPLKHLSSLHAHCRCVCPCASNWISKMIVLLIRYANLAHICCFHFFGQVTWCGLIGQSIASCPPSASR